MVNASPLAQCPIRILSLREKEIESDSCRAKMQLTESPTMLESLFLNIMFSLPL